MVAPNDESVQYNLLLNAQQALKELQAFNKAAISSGGAVDSLQKRIINFEQVVAAEAKKAGVAFEQQLAAFERLDARLKTSKKAGVVGASGGIDPFQATQAQHNKVEMTNEAYTKGLKQRQQASEVLIAENRKLLSQATEIGKTQSDTWNKIGSTSQEGAKKVVKGFDGMRIAMSIFAYDLVRNGLQAVQQFFTQAIDQARQLEASLYRLQNAERILSKGGINISMEGLRKGVQDIKKLLPIFSQEDITQTVGALAVSTKQLGLTEEQILGLAKAAAIYNVQSVETETLLQSQAKLVTALISPAAKSIGEYGISFGKVTMEAKALEMGILKVGESVAKLTDAQKAQVKYAIIMEGADSNLASINDYLETNTAKLEKNKAAWKDLQTTIGQVIMPFVPAVTSLLNFIKGGVEGGKVLVAVFASIAKVIFMFSSPLKIFKLAKDEGITSIKGLVDYAIFAFKNLRDQWLRSLFPDIPANAPKFLKKMFDDAGVGKFKDTPTSTQAIDIEVDSSFGSKYTEAVKEAEEKVTEIMKEAREKREDSARDHANKIADLSRDLERKLSDIARSLRDKMEDAQKDYGDKITDINSDTDKKIAEAKQDSYKKSIEAEQKYQDELKNLRERYLMDLEEALRARDARQILKLMKQYALDRNKAVENRDKEREEAKSESAQKIRDLEEERKEKLAQAAKDLADKIKQAQFAAKRERREAGIAHQRALEDARQAYQRQLAEQRLFLQRKLADLAASIASEYKLTAAGQAAIRNIIATSAGGSQGASSAQYTSATPTVSSTWAQAGLYGTGGMAEGGTFLATRPATINVGENRPEVITATPLGKPGKDISKVFTNGSVGGGSSGQIEVGLTLSPDLEARIISQTLSETADVILKINRSK